MPRSRGRAGEVLAFSDANSTWEPDALGRLVARLADPRIGYACGQLRLEGEGGENQEGVYWRYETAVRALESRLAGVTAGNGAINAVRREAYIALEPTRGQDISFPYELTKRGWRAVFEPGAVAREPMAATLGSEFRRKRRMLAGAWATMLRHGMLSPRGYGPAYAFEILSHRALRYLSPILHLIALGTNLALLGHGWLYAVTLAAQLALLGGCGAGACGAAPRLPARSLLRRGHRGERRRPLGLPAAGGAPHLGEGRGHAVRGLPRIVDVTLAGIGLALAQPVRC